jgi:small subunit ribosomal protein S6
MRLYEIVYIFDAALAEDAVTSKLERYHELLTGSNGEVKAVDLWGPRQLSYPVEGRKMGSYVVAHVEASPEALAEFERHLKLDDEILRYLLVLNEGEPTSGMSVLSERPERASRDDDEEEEEDEDDDSPPEFSGGRGRRRRHDGPAVELLNYKDVSTLSRFLTEQGKILPKRTTKVTARFQRQLGSAVKRARYLALIPYVRDHEA